jgi:hypothetical protein
MRTKIMGKEAVWLRCDTPIDWIGPQGMTGWAGRFT